MVEKRERLGCLAPSSLPTRCGLVETALFCGTVVFRQASLTVSLGLEPIPCSVNHALFRTLQALAWQLLPLLLLALESYTMTGHALLISLNSPQIFVNVLLKISSISPSGCATCLWLGYWQMLYLTHTHRKTSPVVRQLDTLFKGRHVVTLVPDL